jgi:hypothetical protein
VLDPNKWHLHPKPVFIAANDVLEDFSVVRVAKHFEAYFTHGLDLQDQRLYRAYGHSPLGPFIDAVCLSPANGVHTRLYRARIDDKRRLVTAVWPGLPKAGIWLFYDLALPGQLLSEKTLLVPPQEGTLFSVAAANPCHIIDASGEHNVFFEGRAEPIYWRLFQTVWDGKNPRSARTRIQPICDGANPYCALFDNTYYLYFSKLAVTGGFETWALTQPAD